MHIPWIDGSCRQAIRCPFFTLCFQWPIVLILMTYLKVHISFCGHLMWYWDNVINPESAKQNCNREDFFFFCPWFYYGFCQGCNPLSLQNMFCGTLYTYTKLDEMMWGDKERQQLNFHFLSYLPVVKIYVWIITPELYVISSRNFTNWCISSGQCVWN